VSEVHTPKLIRKELIMLEDKKNNEPSEILKSGESQTCQIFVGGLRPPPKKQTEHPAPENPAEPAEW
jgi:hypothetical protein